MALCNFVKSNKQQRNRSKQKPESSASANSATRASFADNYFDGTNDYATIIPNGKSIRASCHSWQRVCMKGF